MNEVDIGHMMQKWFIILNPNSSSIHSVAKNHS